MFFLTMIIRKWIVISLKLIHFVFSMEKTWKESPRIKIKYIYIINSQSIKQNSCLCGIFNGVANTIKVRDYSKYEMQIPANKFH